VDSSTDDKTAASVKFQPWIVGVVSVLAAILVAGAVLAIPYRRLAKRVDHQLAGPLGDSVDYYSASETVAVGDPMTPADLATAFKGAVPPVDISLSKGRVVLITDRETHRSLSSYQIKPQLLTNLSAQGRAKRIPVDFSAIPTLLLRAILSAEDKRFFRHSGLDTLRIVKATYVDLKARRKQQGASTITMQLARNLSLRRNKSWKRKIEEVMITVHLEHKLSKNQIFEKYCNLVYLGGDGAFGINGVGEAAQAYFNKDVRQLSLPEAATIAGLIQRPVYLNPFRYPNRALDRRNVVLKRMLQNKYITGEEYAEATAATLGLHGGATELSESQYFVDAAAKEAARESDDQSETARAVYTTLDLRLQHAAEHAIVACNWSTSNWRPAVGPLHQSDRR
jgi:penicillin-binding protein 1B